jgi:tricorn protease
MLINHFSASDGDMFPYHFRAYGLGKLVGTRTWGGVRGIRTFWSLLDGGYVTIPEITFSGLDGHWALENRGNEPDVDIEDQPWEVDAGGDVQLEAAVRDLLQQLPQRHAPPPLPGDTPSYAPGGDTPPSAAGRHTATGP